MTLVDSPGGEPGDTESFADRFGHCRPNDPRPLYLQIQGMIREAIKSGALTPSSGIPAERDLAVDYGVSRITFRKSLEDLVEEGLLIRRRGAGTFVAGRVEKMFAKLSS